MTAKDPNQVWATDVPYIRLPSGFMCLVAIVDLYSRKVLSWRLMCRSLKYEDIYLNSYESLGELHDGVDRYFRFYNTERFHQGMNYRTPEEAYQSFVSEQPLPLAG